MNRYQRRHSNNNTSKGIYLILFAGAIAFLVYKVIEFKRKVKEAHEIEVKEKNKTPEPVLKGVKNFPQRH